jgi:hypothetical protein
MSKVEKLCAACELFSLALKEIPGKASETLGQSCAGVRSLVATAREGTPKPTPSQLAAGLEQGWREVLDSLSSFPKRMAARRGKGVVLCDRARISRVHGK